MNAVKASGGCVSAAPLQPTKALFDEFTRAFYQSDVLIVMPIYSAGEKRIDGIGSNMLAEKIRAHGHKDVMYAENPDAAIVYLKNHQNRRCGDYSGCG